MGMWKSFKENIADAFNRNPTTATIERACRLFHKQPSSYFRSFASKTYDWPEENDFIPAQPSLKDVYVAVGDRKLAYAQNITLDRSKTICSIGHFATEADFQRRGVGSTFAQAIREEVSRRYGVREIVFNESSVRKQNSVFFASLGTIEVPDQANKQPSWRWPLCKTVLVVDDDPAVRMLVTGILKDLGYPAIEAGNSAAGLKVLQSKVRIDLLVTDVDLLGGMNGRQMADAGRVSRSDLKVLFIPGHAENAIFANGHLAPGMEVLTKPFSNKEMATRIRSIIEADR